MLYINVCFDINPCLLSFETSLLFRYLCRREKGSKTFDSVNGLGAAGSIQCDDGDKILPPPSSRYA